MLVHVSWFGDRIRIGLSNFLLLGVGSGDETTRMYYVVLSPDPTAQGFGAGYETNLHIPPKESCDCMQGARAHMVHICMVDRYICAQYIHY